MKILYLRASSREELIQVLTAAEMWTEDKVGSRFLPKTIGDTLDMIGIIYKETGETITVDGMTFPKTEPIPGYHANLILYGDIPSELESILISKPNNPVRVWL